MKNKRNKYVFLAFGVAAIICYGYIKLATFTHQHEVRRTSAITQKPHRWYIRSNVTKHKSENVVTFGKRQIFDINCRKIIEGDESEINKSKALQYRIPTDLTVTAATANCEHFRSVYGYDDVPNTNEEREFPIAYNILLYKDVAQVEMLLRLIYKPQNYYCLHVDWDSPSEVHHAVKSLANCFHNVFLASKSESVVYKSFARLQADINCMSDHLDLGEDWKYLINLPSQEFPLKTNAEIVKILKIYNNSNDIEGIIKRGSVIESRYIFKHVRVNEASGTGTYSIKSTSVKNPAPPHNITIVKGSAYGVFTRGFVDYVVNNKVAIDFRNWCRTVLSPDEYYWATLNHNPHLNVPGSYLGRADEKPWLATYASWNGVDTCKGKWMRGVCVYGVGDLNKLVQRKELFANKFEINFQPLALQCLSEWLYNKTISPLPFDSFYYKQLPFIHNHL